MQALIEHGKQEYSSAIEFLDSSGKKYSADKLTFKELDQWRNNDLPQVIATRYKKHNETWMTKEELVKLMDWKLMKGKFRPTLPKLIKSNEEKTVLQVTKLLFKSFLELSSTDSVPELKKVLNKLCELRGVGPATSTLMLSLTSSLIKLTDNKHLTAPPFFSDESFFWFNPDYGKLKYTLKEYFELYYSKYIEIANGETDWNLIEKSTWAIYKQKELNPEFQIEPSYLENYDKYIQEVSKIKGEKVVKSKKS